MAANSQWQTRMRRARFVAGLQIVDLDRLIDPWSVSFPEMYGDTNKVSPSSSPFGQNRKGPTWLGVIAL